MKAPRKRNPSRKPAADTTASGKPPANPTADPAAGRTAGPTGQLHAPPVFDVPTDHWPSDVGIQLGEFGSLADDVPVLFMPVRLETRFTDRTRTEARQLKVRVYPDQIHVDDHDPGLTGKERKIGRAYWKAWREAVAAKDEAAQTAARQWLTQQLPARRAAWVARLTDPRRARPAADAEEARAPRAACLPYRWALVGFTRDGDGQLQQEFVKWTKPIREELRTGVDLTSYGASRGAGALPADDGMLWMVDYDEAVEAGMALTIDLGDHPTVAAGGLAVLLAVGVSKADAAEGVSALTGLLQAHHYAEGLAFAPQGTPTNNTDQVDSPWSFREVDPLALLARELDGADAATDPASNGKRAAQALGRPDHPLLARLEHAIDDEESGQEAMNRVLWPVTLGQYFDRLLAGEESASAVPSNGISNLKQRFIRDVRGGAPLPSLRVGAQPYGLLPVRWSEAPLGAWQDASPWFEYVLHRLRGSWLEAADTVVPRMDPVLGASGGTASNDPDPVLSEILSNLPHPARFLVRELRSWRTKDTENIDDFGDIILSALLPFLYYDDPTFGYEALSVLGRWGWALEILGGSDYLGISQAQLSDIDDPGLSSATAQIAALNALRDWVGSHLDLPGDRDGARAWIDSLINLVEQHRDRQGPLLDFVGGAVFKGIIADEVDDPTLFYSVYARDDDSAPFELPLVRSPYASASRWLASLRERVTGGLVPGDGDVVDAGQVVIDRGVAPVSGGIGRSARQGAPGLRAARRAARRARRAGPAVGTAAGPIDVDPHAPDGNTVPQGLPLLFHTAEPLLYQLLDSVVEDVGGLEAGPYRAALDTLAGESADALELRLRETLGLASHRLDAYFTSMARKRLDELRRTKTGLHLGGYGWVIDLVPDRSSALDSQGFIHAPSIAQATTAAILRAGWSAHGTGDPASPMAVDLRSDRVRTASWLLDAVRQGQSLGEALGYRFERSLHDAALDAWIDPVRRAVLLDQDVGQAPRGPVDGLDLLDLWGRTGSATKLLLDVPSEYLPSGTPEVLRVHLESVSGALDAAGDAAIAESVHQVAQGNMTRAAATLDAVNLGEVAPPELGELGTPVAGVGVTHRLVVLLGSTERTAGWARGPRAVFDPALEAWASTVLGSAGSVYAHTRWIDGAGTASAWEPIAMADLGMSALDAVMEAPTAAPTSESGWARRVEAAVRAKLPWETPEDFRVEIDFGLAPPGTVSMAELADVARPLRSLLGRARALDARDLDLPGGAATGVVVGDLERRVAALEKELREAAEVFLKLLPEERVDDEHPAPVGDASADTLRTAMRAFAAFGFLGALPTVGWSGTEADTARLWSAAWSLGRKVTKRLAALDALREGDGSSAPTPEARVERARGVVRIVLGRAFPVVPRFTPSAAQPVDELFAASDSLTGGDTAAISSFVTQAGRVRPDTATFDETTLVAETLQGALVSELRVAQRPEVAGEPWVASHLPEAETGGRVHWIAADHGGIAAAASGTAAGLLVDEWVERIPSSRQSTGVAFHFDAPASRPPQALLLAVTPDDATGWDFDLVVATLVQTLEDARLRAVAPQALGAFGHHLPAIYPPARLKTAATTV